VRANKLARQYLQLVHTAIGRSPLYRDVAPLQVPVGGRKPFTESAWSRRVFVERRSYIGNTAEDIRAVFFDHALIASLDCDAVPNVPVTHDGRVLGTLNLFHEAGWYGEADVAPGLLFATFAVPGYLTLP
jgi:hypothetical protein